MVPGGVGTKNPYIKNTQNPIALRSRRASFDFFVVLVSNSSPFHGNSIGFDATSLHTSLNLCSKYLIVSQGYEAAFLAGHCMMCVKFTPTWA